MGFTIEHIDRAMSRVSRLMPAKPNRESAREYSLKDCVFLMAPKLLEKKEMGCTTNELVQALSDEYILIKGATLNRYLHEYQSAQGCEPANPEPGAVGRPSNPATASPGAGHQSAKRPDSVKSESAKCAVDDSAAI